MRSRQPCKADASCGNSAFLRLFSRFQRIFRLRENAVSLETAAKHRDDTIYVEWSVNEKSALEVAAGAAYTGARSLVTMKQVGLNVASDPLMSLVVGRKRTGVPYSSEYVKASATPELLPPKCWRQWQSTGPTIPRMFRTAYIQLL